MWMVPEEKVILRLVWVWIGMPRDDRTCRDLPEISFCHLSKMRLRIVHNGRFIISFRKKRFVFLKFALNVDEVFLT